MVEVEAGVATVTLNRPEARNALDSRLLGELSAALWAVEADPDVGMVVLTGAGPSFCAGADLKEMSAQHDQDDFFVTRARTDQSMNVHLALVQMTTPVIAAVNGHALAGGCGLALSCDLVFAAESATFGYPEVLRGQVAALVMANLVRVVGRKPAMELLLSGRRIDAAEATRLSMVNRVVPDDRLLAETLSYARELAGRSRSSVQMTKELFYRVSEGTYDQAIRIARDANLLMKSTRDSHDGARTFAERSRIDRHGAPGQN
ncbi:enoyl-CoA hydratase/isomerase family protein [Nocardioides humi]|uniref:enoyl-CoA hydratase/isomerase family protein n=1 Tax=Nocardioides humi TaxID=449461 RepID=UPI0015E861E3|nr:enoyl-CoA hydratase/isomerase family protein [Nocardioides humi]